jgi:hypothetical protein
MIALVILFDPSHWREVHVWPVTSLCLSYLATSCSATTAPASRVRRLAVANPSVRACTTEMHLSSPAKDSFVRKNARWVEKMTDDDDLRSARALYRSGPAEQQFCAEWRCYRLRGQTSAPTI